MAKARMKPFPLVGFCKSNFSFVKKSIAVGFNRRLENYYEKGL
jgi:hypothetical protein